jgi:hypothetical protein
MTEVIESGVGAINFGRQSARGSVATAATTTVGYNKPKVADGTGLKGAKTLDNEEYVDGNVWGSPTNFTKSVGGEVGTVVVQTQPENAGLYFAQMLAVDTVTGAGDPFTHTITSAGITAAYGTWWQKVGSAIGPEREVYWDSKINKLTWEIGQEQYVGHQTMDIMALKAAEVFATDPAKTEDTSDPFLWSEVTGAVTFDGTVDTDCDGEVLELDKGMEAHWGDSHEPAQLVSKKGTIIRTIKSIVTDGTLLKYRKALYNNTAPSTGTRPVKTVFEAAATTLYTRSATRTLSISTPRIAVNPQDMAIGPMAEGGKIPIEFTGMCLKSGGTPALTVVVLSGDATTYA